MDFTRTRIIIFSVNINQSKPLRVQLLTFHVYIFGLPIYHLYEHCRSANLAYSEENLNFKIVALQKSYRF